MRIEIIKTKNGFRIPQLESMTIPDKLFATVDMPFPTHQTYTPAHKKTTHQLIEKTVNGLGGDNLLEGIMNRLPQNYQYISNNISDKDVLYEALKEKYGL